MVSAQSVWQCATRPSCWLATWLVVAGMTGPTAAAVAAPTLPAMRLDTGSGCIIGPGADDTALLRRAGRSGAARATVDGPHPRQGTAVTGELIASPAEIRLGRTIGPGESAACLVHIENRTGTTARVKLAAVGIVGVDEPGLARSTAFVEADDSRAGDTAIAWIRPLVANMDLGSLEEVDIPVYLSVPRGSPTRNAYAGLSIEPLDATTGDDTTNGSNLGVRTRIIVPILASIDGVPADSDLRLRDIATSRVKWNRQAWDFAARVQNEGPSHGIPRGQLRVRSVFGGVVARFDLATGTLLPGAAAPIRAHWDGVPWFGLYRVEAEVEDKGGPAGSRTSSDSYSGWLLALPPWWMLAVIAGLLTAALVGAIVRHRLALDEDHSDAAWNHEH